MFRPVARLKSFRLQTRCYSSASSSSSQENPELVPDKEADKAKAVAQKTVFGKWLPSKNLSIFGGREPVPWTSALPNKKGVENYDPQFKLGELVDDGPALIKEHTGVSSMHGNAKITGRNLETHARSEGKLRVVPREAEGRRVRLPERSSKR